MLDVGAPSVEVATIGRETERVDEVILGVEGEVVAEGDLTELDVVALEDVLSGRTGVEPLAILLAIGHDVILGSILLVTVNNDTILADAILSSLLKHT